MRTLSTLVVVLLLTSTVVAQSPRPIRLIAEAEDFAVENGAWDVVPFRENYYAATFAVAFLSRMACLGAPEQVKDEAIATQTIDVPEAGEFQVLARYEQPFNFSVEFTVAIHQGGKEVYREVFGRLQDDRIWALNGHKRKPMERFSWGPTDNLVWQQKSPVKLQKGPAKLTLIAGPQSGPRAARRHVDVICLTNDVAGIEAQKKTNYLEFDGWLTQAGDVFTRFTNPKDAVGGVIPIVAPFDQGQHSPYYIHVRDWPTTHVVKSGRIESATTYHLTGPRSLAVKAETLAPVLDPTRYRDAKAQMTFADGDYLAPGESSGWVPLGQALDSLNNSQWFPRVINKAKGNDVYLRIEFAVPDGKGGLNVVKDVTVKGPASNLSPAAFEIPGNVAPNPRLATVLKERWWSPTIRTQKEALDFLNAEVAKFPKIGKRPERLLVYNIMGFSSALSHFTEAKQLALALGDNTAVDVEGKKTRLVAHWPDPSVASIQAKEQKTPEAFKDLRIVSYGDEIHLPAMTPTPVEFADWLKSRDVVYDGKIEYVPPASAKNPNAREHPLYYYSQLCAREKGGRHYAAGTAYYGSKGILTGANYSPHANYLINDLDYVRPFRMKAMSMPWGEDYIWQIPDYSVQIMGYLTSGFRAGAKYHDLPIHMYVMPHSPGNTPRGFRQSFYTTIAHGAKMINYFCASPSAVGNTENYVDTNDVPMWKELHRCTHEAGIFEDYVMDGKVRPAQVGMLLSSVDDIMTGINNFSLAMHNNERKALYLALRHSQTLVDFVTEDDLIDGRLKDYKLIYVTQQWLHSKTIASLEAFAKAGGTVVALAGGGFKDEFNRPSEAAKKLYGIASQELTTDPNLVAKYLLAPNIPFFPKVDLPVYEPIDHVSWKIDGGSGPGSSAEKAPVIVWKQSLKVGDGTVVGKFSDGSPAVVEKTHGKGRVVLFGFLPGQAYLKKALPMRPVDRGAIDSSYAHFLPRATTLTDRDGLVTPFLRPGDFSRPVSSNRPLVEVTRIDTHDANGKLTRVAIPAINFLGEPVDQVTIHVEGIDAVRSVRSVERGKVDHEIRNGRLQMTLPLDVADMILIDR